MADLKPIRYSVLDLALVTQGGTAGDAFRRSLDLARHVEQWGYTRFWLAEHHNMEGVGSSATSVLIGYIASGTSTLRVGSGGVMLPNHSPLVIAEQFGTLETLYPGRIDLGVGRAPGSDRLTAHALRRGLDEEDFPQEVQKLIGYFDSAPTGRLVRAIPGMGTHVPVWLLGSSTYSAELAAALGLPFAFASHFAPDQLDQALAIYRQSFRPSRWLESPYAAVGVPLVAAETDGDAQILATTPYQRFLQLIRGEPLYSRPPVENMDRIWNSQERALVESKLGVAVIGGPETVRRKLAALAERTQADEFIFTSDLYRHSDRLRSFEIVAGILGNAPVAPAETADRK